MCSMDYFPIRPCFLSLIYGVGIWKSRTHNLIFQNGEKTDVLEGKWNECLLFRLILYGVLWQSKSFFFYTYGTKTSEIGFIIQVWIWLRGRREIVLCWLRKFFNFVWSCWSASTDGHREIGDAFSNRPMKLLVLRGLIYRPEIWRASAYGAHLSKPSKLVCRREWVKW